MLKMYFPIQNYYSLNIYEILIFLIQTSTNPNIEMRYVKRTVKTMSLAHQLLFESWKLNITRSCQKQAVATGSHFEVRSSDLRIWLGSKTSFGAFAVMNNGTFLLELSSIYPLQIDLRMVGSTTLAVSQHTTFDVNLLHQYIFQFKLDYQYP